MGESIFEQLKKNHICYCVCVSVSISRNKAIDVTGKEYFILSRHKDIVHEKLGFKECQGYSKLMERTLFKDEVSEFKEIQNTFNKVIHNEHGRL